MNITTSTNVVDDTYSRTDEHAPTIDANGITIYTGRGSSRSWGTPGTTSTIVLNDDDFCAIHVGFHHKHGGGQFWRYYTTDGVTVSAVEWRQIPDEQRVRILAAYDAKAPGWAKSPGKLRANYAKPSKAARTAYKLVEVRADGTMASLYDGETIYTLGKRLAQAAHGGVDDYGEVRHSGGYYAHPTRGQVSRLYISGGLVPASCLEGVREMAMLEVEISGTIIEYPNGKLAATYLKPVAVLATFTRETAQAA